LSADSADLAIVGGRVIDPASGVDALGTVTIRDGLIESISGDDASPSAPRALDASGLLVVPGLVDLHTHVYRGVSHYGIDPDERCLAHGVTTAVDAGSAGAQTFPGLRRYVIEGARTRVLAYVHVSVLGMVSDRAGELEDLRWGSPADAAACAREHADVAVGIKVRLGYQMVGPDPEPALRLAREAADLAELPLMVHVIDMLRPITWLLPYLQAGDIVTHCFHGNEGGVLDERGRVFPEVFRARERGVVFDVGHGIGSFAWRIARIATAEGLWPTTISSDIHAHNVNGPVFDQPTTLSKLLHLGMPLTEIIRATTVAPAAALRRDDELGSLEPGREADLTLLEVVAGEWRLTDGAEETVVASDLLVPRWVVRAGEALACETAAPELAAHAPTVASTRR
jgi:dihydroorotase